MNHMRSITLLLAAFLLFSCETGVDERAGAKYGFDRATATLLEASELAAQSFSIDNSRDTVLFGNRGTIVSVPADCFKDANGLIQVELIEAPDMSDLLLLNAPTISDGKLLVTDGVVYVNAFINSEPLKVRDGKSVENEIPSSNLDESMGSFIGAYDGAGRLTWAPGNEMTETIEQEVREQLTYEFLTIPMELFPNRARYFRMDSIAKTYPWVNGELHVPDDDLLVGKERAAFYADAVSFLNNPASEGTPMATREFAQRLEQLESYYYYWFWPQPDGTAKLAYDVFGPFQHRIFQVYLSNMNRDLWYSDSLALNVMEEWVPRNKKDTVERSSYERSRNWFTYFKKQRLTKPVVIDDHAFDLNASDAYRKLLDQGVEKNEARQLLELNGLRQRAIEELRNVRIVTASGIAAVDMRIAQERESASVRYYLISAVDLGWINVDRFYDAPNALECEVIAEVAAPEGANPVNVSLVFNGSKTLVDGIRSAGGRYHFTKDDEYYRRLPVGEEATMVAISYANGKPWLAIKRITIAEHMNERLELSAMSMDDFKAALKAIN